MSVVYTEPNPFEVFCSVFIYENQLRKHWSVHLPLYKGSSVYLWFHIFVDRAVEKSDRCSEKMVNIQNDIITNDMIFHLFLLHFSLPFLLPLLKIHE